MISNDFQLNPTPRVEAAWPWSRNAMEMTRKHWNVRLLTYQKPGKHSWCREYWNWFPLSPSWWWCCFDGVGDDKKWEVKLEQDAVYIVKIDWLIYTNDKGFRGEDFVDAIRILIQATETTIWLQCNAGPQYSNCFTSPFQILLCYCIYFWQYSISLFSTSFLVFLTVYVAKEMVNMVGIIICFCVERSQKVWW